MGRNPRLRTRHGAGRIGRSTIITNQAGYEIGRDESGLTARDRAVLAGFRRGLNGNQIATELAVSRGRVSQIRRKLLKLQYDLTPGSQQRPQAKINVMFAFLATSPETGDEGLVHFVRHYRDPDSGERVEADFPLVAADSARLDDLRGAAQDMATEAGLEIRVAKFTVRIDGDLIRPQRKARP